MHKKLLLGFVLTLLLAGIAGCSNSSQSSDTKSNDQKTTQSSNNMNMTPSEMQNMNSSDKK